jgi:hypothetical protein
MKGSFAVLVLCVALALDGHAQPLRPPLDVVAALERIRDTGVFPEYLSLEYVELHRRVHEVVERDHHGYVAGLAGQVLTRVVVNLEKPLIPSGEQPSFTADFIDGPEPGRMHRADFYGSLDGGPWKLLSQLGYGADGALGGILCGEEIFGPAACAPGWHAIAMRAVVSAWTGDNAEPAWTETRELPVQVYGVYRTTDLARFPSSPVSRATPAAWMRAVLDAPASFVDSQLSSDPLPLWLASTLRAAGRPDLAGSVRWESRPCGVDMVERFADRSRAPVCITAEAAGRDDELSLEFSVGPLAREVGPRRWPEAATFHRGQLADRRGSLDLARLSELAEAFEKPRRSWPGADLRVLPIDILYSPLVPNPGDTITVEFTVHNDGLQDTRALIEFWLDAAGVEQEERLDFVADVPAGRYYRFMRAIRLPHGSGTGFAGLRAQHAPPRGSMKPVEEKNPNDNDAVRLLGALRVKEVGGRR